VSDEATREEVREWAAALTADDVERIFHASLERGDMRGVEASLRLLAVKDPHRAQDLMDLCRMALIVAEARQ
jgi:hypothetical protein